MSFANRPKIAIMCFSRRNIFHNGMGIGVNTLYTNVNGIENKYASITPITPLLPSSQFLEKSLDDEISNYKKNTEEAYQQINTIHKRNLQRTKSQFFDIKKFIENMKNDELDEITLKKEKELKDLEEYDNNMEFDRADLNDTFMQTETNKIKHNFSSMRNKIDKQYKFKKPKLEMNSNDLERMQKYKKEIKRLNTYSNNPNYNNVINTFKLNNYV